MSTSLSLLQLSLQLLSNVCTCAVGNKSVRVGELAGSPVFAKPKDTISWSGAADAPLMCDWAEIWPGSKIGSELASSYTSTLRSSNCFLSLCTPSHLITLKQEKLSSVLPLFHMSRSWGTFFFTLVWVTSKINGLLPTMFAWFLKKWLSFCHVALLS